MTIKRFKKTRQVKKTSMGREIFAKLFLPTIVTVSVLGFSLSAIAYNEQKTNMINDTIDASEVIASVASNAINSDDLMAIKTKEDTTKVVYYKLLTQFDMINQDKHLKDIYSIYFDENKNIYYGAIAPRGDEILTGSIVKHLSNSYPNITTLSNNEIISSNDVLLNDYNEPIISSYAPIFDRQENLIGAIVCDYDATPIQQALHELLTKLILLTVAGIIVSCIILSIIIVSIVKKLIRINQRIENISQDGSDLTATLNLNSSDELGEFSYHINNLLSYIRKILLNIKKNVSSIDSNVDVAYTGIAEADNNIIETYTNLQTINDSVADITLSIDNIDSASTDILSTISNSTTKLSEGINYALSIKEHAQMTADESLRKQNQATQNIYALSSALSNKLETSKNVIKIADLAKDIITITDETNLLALNASIKAAKAGKQGKGFAVIADEIGSLAITTEASAKQIEKASKYIIKSVNDLSIAIEDMLAFINELCNSVFNDLVTNSELYLRNSDQLASILEHFSDFTTILNDQLSEVQENISDMKSNVHTSNKNMTDASSLSKDLANRTNMIRDALTQTKNIGLSLNKDVTNYKL